MLFVKVDNHFRTSAGIISYAADVFPFYGNFLLFGGVVDSIFADCEFCREISRTPRQEWQY